MKKLLTYLLFFILPIIILVLIIPVDKRLKYIGLKDDCFNHGIWIYDRINHNPKPIDIAFLGSSKTINGVNDKLISDSLESFSAANLGYCRLGRNLHYVLLKELVSVKRIKKLVLEVRKDENKFSHPIFPFTADSKDVLFSNKSFNRDFLKDIWNHFSFKIELFQDRLYKDSIVEYQLADFGHSAFDDTVHVEILEEHVQSELINMREPLRIEDEYHRNFYKVYLRKISEICSKNKIELYFLYIPSFRNKTDEIEEKHLYKSLGQLLIPPEIIYQDKNNWFDPDHLNSAGAQKLSDWLAIELMK